MAQGITTSSMRAWFTRSEVRAVRKEFARLSGENPSLEMAVDGSPCKHGGTGGNFFRFKLGFYGIELCPAYIGSIGCSGGKENACRLVIRDYSQCLAIFDSVVGGKAIPAEKVLAIAVEIVGQMDGMRRLG